MDEALAGVIAAAVATVSWAVAPVMIRLGLTYPVSPTLLAGVRALSGFALLLPIYLTYVHEVYLNPHILLMIIISGILVGVGDVLYIVSIKNLGSWRAILIAYQYILIAQVLAFTLLNEVRGVYAMFFTPLALLGIYIALREGGNGGISLRDVVVAYAPAVMWGVATVISRYLADVSNNVAVATLRALILATTFTALGCRSLKSLRRLGSGSLGYILISGIFTHVGGFLSFLYALKYIGTFLSTLVNSISPLITQLMARKLSNEYVSLRQVIGVLVTVAAVATALTLQYICNAP